MKRAALIWPLLAGIAALPAPAYYHFIHYLQQGNAPEKFDLNVLPNKTVTFFVSQNGPAVFSQNDTFNSVLSQVRQATQVWNGVVTSDLRVAFGGVENPATPQNAPGGDIVFEDLPPGLLGYGGPTSKNDPVTSGKSPFIPIVRSTVHLNRDLTLRPGPSYNESFFLTAVHEMGHALGLQHTFTSAAMSTATTRATSLSKPIDADDMAGLSVLYPNAAFSKMGSITGRITASGGQGIHLASVVAIRPGGAAVSGMTNPDGTYRIDGVPPGIYTMYVHSLPPDADIRGPWNVDGSAAPGGSATDTVFYPGTKNFLQAGQVTVRGGSSTDGVNWSVRTRASVPIYDVSVYGYFNQNTVAVKPAAVSLQNSGSTVVASGAGLGANDQSPGLGVQVMGGSVQVQSGGVRPYTSGGFTYVALDLVYSLGATPGPQHVVFSTPDYLYVLPSGISLTQRNPPTVTGVANNGDGTLTVTGTNWATDSLVYFDGLPAGIRSLDPGAGVAVVVPPVGASGQHATLTVYNTDGQNSQFVQANSPVTFSFDAAVAPSIASVSPSSLPAGSEAMIDITGSGTHFVQDATTVGFGSSDVLVRRVFVLSPTHLLVDISVGQNAALATTDVSVISGFQIASAAGAFQTTPPTAGKPTAVPLLFNALPLLSGSYAGATVSLYGSNLALNESATVTFNDQRAKILFASASQINLVIPDGLNPGPAILKVNNGADNAFLVAVNIDPPPAGITAVRNVSGAYVYAGRAAHPGDQLIVSLTGFADPSAIIPLNRVRVNLGGMDHSPISVTYAGNSFQVAFLLNSADSPGQQVPLVVYIDERSSLPAYIPITAPNGSFSAIAE